MAYRSIIAILTVTSLLTVASAQAQVSGQRTAPEHAKRPKPRPLECVKEYIEKRAYGDVLNARDPERRGDTVRQTVTTTKGEYTFIVKQDEVIGLKSNAEELQAAERAKREAAEQEAREDREDAAKARMYKGKATLDKYDELEIGMSHSEVVGIMGSSGTVTETSRKSSDGKAVHSMSVSWHGRAESGWLHCDFDASGRLEYKTQTGLK